MGIGQHGWNFPDFIQAKSYIRLRSRHHNVIAFLDRISSLAICSPARSYSNRSKLSILQQALDSSLLPFCTAWPSRVITAQFVERLYSLAQFSPRFFQNPKQA